MVSTTVLHTHSAGVPRRCGPRLVTSWVRLPLASMIPSGKCSAAPASNLRIRQRRPGQYRQSHESDWNAIRSHTQRSPAPRGRYSRSDTLAPVSSGQSSRTSASSCWSARRARPTVDKPWPFTQHEFARLLLLRSRLEDGLARDCAAEVLEHAATAPSMWIARCGSTGSCAWTATPGK